jgi:hypothetical protein
MTFLRERERETTNSIHRSHAPKPIKTSTDDDQVAHDFDERQVNSRIDTNRMQQLPFGKKNNPSSLVDHHRCQQLISNGRHRCRHVNDARVSRMKRVDVRDGISLRIDTNTFEILERFIDVISSCMWIVMFGRGRRYRRIVPDAVERHHCLEKIRFVPIEAHEHGHTPNRRTRQCSARGRTID